MAKNYYPTNVDLLNIGHACNLSCRQCFYQEPIILRKRNVNCDLKVAKNIINKFSDSSIFIYPMEISTSMEVLPLISHIGQKSILSNGIALDKQKIAMFVDSGVEEIKITLFANYYEYNFFNQVSEEYYEKIINNIKLCKRAGLKVIINNVLSKITKNSISELISKGVDIGVDKIEFIRLKPVGNARKFNPEIYLEEKDMLDIILDIERYKLKNPKMYLGYSLSFGPDFYNKTEAEAKEKIKKGNKEWVKTKYLCPSINGNYFGISLRTGMIYSCFFAMDQEEFSLGEINLENGRIIQLNDYALDSDILSDRLRGNCNKDNCEYHAICLGGCRSTAFIFAKLRGEADPMFSEMDICITKCKKKLTF